MARGRSGQNNCGSERTRTLSGAETYSDLSIPCPGHPGTLACLRRSILTGTTRYARDEDALTWKHAGLGFEENKVRSCQFQHRPVAVVMMESNALSLRTWSLPPAASLIRRLKTVSSSARSQASLCIGCLSLSGFTPASLLRTLTTPKLAHPQIPQTICTKRSFCFCPPCQ
ncbi:uncharacterized protein HMPREF1120_05397 [Exophiala dermatitidis NIH/UT8656]|uniref:Uncharacterized protein n=1 Tax=Exophiala dermatitidis (strain ATCC 34100 / CBS 525.76 / NIH/UT8656) TaxID=858893 RepID=H6C173_EXODN|nr:uncharacterized protein HMPREF1120_05397 [Exophiala dermatitidis NIH/UT8656]EHY57356.1 hypothetical protein HMPREF1120_05397 [Exophiala dermatitidis NIH/UT8656]